MSETKSHRAHIRIATRNGHIRPYVKWRFIDLEGASAVVVIVIILAARFMDVIFGLLWDVLAYLAPRARVLLARFARSSARSLYRAYLTFVAFYTH